MISHKNTPTITTINKANGREVIINSFCNAIKTLISGRALPNTIMAIANSAIPTDQINRCLRLGVGFPLSVNILNTNTAESTEVTKKLMSKTIVITLSILAKPKKSAHRRNDQDTQ